MTQYIDKSAVMAEIERRIADNKKDIERSSHKNLEDYFEGYEDALVLFKEKFLNTLEVKEEVTTTDAFIKKACDWLTKHAKKYYFNKERYLGTDELVEDFKLSMEI